MLQHFDATSNVAYLLKVRFGGFVNGKKKAWLWAPSENRPRAGGIIGFFRNVSAPGAPQQ